MAPTRRGFLGGMAVAPIAAPKAAKAVVDKMSMEGLPMIAKAGYPMAQCDIEAPEEENPIAQALRNSWKAKLRRFLAHRQTACDHQHQEVKFATKKSWSPVFKAHCQIKHRERIDELDSSQYLHDLDEIRSLASKLGIEL